MHASRWIAAIAVIACSCKQHDPHHGADPSFPLLGKHADLSCEACHGPGRPKDLPTQCIGCHSGDVPNEPGGHHLGQDCAPCHTAYGWDVFDGSTPTSPETTPIPEHEGLDPYGEGVICGDCHEQDRPTDDSAEDSHWRTPTAWTADCAPCHSMRDWSEPSLFEPLHQFRAPHGLRNQNFPVPRDQWIVACDGCHPDRTDYAKFVCYDCHVAVNPDGHLVPKPTDEACLECHLTGMPL